MSSGVGRGGGKGEENGRVAISQLLFPSSREGKKSYLEEISVHLREGNECSCALRLLSPEQNLSLWGWGSCVSGGGGGIFSTLREGRKTGSAGFTKFPLKYGKMLNVFFLGSF